MKMMEFAGWVYSVGVGIATRTMLQYIDLAERVHPEAHPPMTHAQADKIAEAYKRYTNRIQ